MTDVDPATPIVFTLDQHPDPAARKWGVDLRSRYLDWCWTPIVGSLAVSLLRHVGDELDGLGPDADWPVTVGEVAGLLGVRPVLVGRTLDRCERFRLCERAGGRVRVWDRVPTLHRGQLAHVSDRVRHAHDVLLDQHHATLTEGVWT